MRSDGNGKLFVLDSTDNVATAIDDVLPGCAALVGNASGQTKAQEKIPRGFKLALKAIPEGTLIVKYGVSIGRATRDIAPGCCVHSHNMASLNDERSGSFASDDATPLDMRYTLED